MWHSPGRGEAYQSLHSWQDTQMETVEVKTGSVQWSSTNSTIIEAARSKDEKLYPTRASGDGGSERNRVLEEEATLGYLRRQMDILGRQEDPGVQGWECMLGAGLLSNRKREVRTGDHSTTRVKRERTRGTQVEREQEPRGHVGKERGLQVRWHSLYHLILEGGHTGWERPLRRCARPLRELLQDRGRGEAQSPSDRVGKAAYEKAEAVNIDDSSSSLAGNPRRQSGQ